MQRLVDEAQRLSRGSVRAAKDIDYATAGTKLARVMERTMDERPAAYNQLRAAVHERLDDIGGVGEERGLFLLAADMATTEALVGGALSSDDRRALRRLWDHLRSS